MQIKCIKSKKNVVKYNQVPTYDLDSTGGREASLGFFWLWKMSTHRKASKLSNIRAFFAI